MISGFTNEGLSKRAFEQSTLTCVTLSLSLLKTMGPWFVGVGVTVHDKQYSIIYP